MKKLVTALIVILPLVLLVAIFAVTGIARVSADIPANGLVINNKGKDGVMFFDIADYRHPICESDLGVEVLPRVARNKNYTLKITDIAGRDTDIVTREKDGSFAFHDTGLTKLTYVSEDGGYSDSVLFNVTASAPLSFKPMLTDATGNACELEDGENTDYKVTLDSGKYALNALCNPSSVIYTNVSYESSNKQILSFTDTNGHFNARFCGDAIITMTANGANGNIKRTIAIRVRSAADTTLEGMDIQSARLNTPIGSKAISFGVQSALNLSADEINVAGENISEYSAEAVDGIDGAFHVNVKLNAAVCDEKSELCTLSLGKINYEFYIDYVNRDFSVFAPANAGGSGDIVMLTGEETRLMISSNPHSPNISYNWSLGEQEAIKIVSANGNECTLKAMAAFGTTLTVEWTEYGDDGEIIASGRIERNVEAVHGYSAIIFAENATSYGLGGLTVATDKYDADGKLVPYTHESKFRAYDKNANPADIFNMEFAVSDPSLAEIRYDGADLFIRVFGNGEVTVTAKWKYGALFGINPAEFTFRAVKGIAADSDESLRRAFDASLPAVLTKDVYLGENLFNYSSTGSRSPKFSPDVMREKLLSYTRELPTTASWQYHKNMGMKEKPTVRYCLDITADLHGNGHFISAQYITDMLDGTDTLYDFAVFNGPLDFVATGNKGIKLAAVKGQDNIVFLARNDGVTIDNAVLKGCDDRTLYDSGEINLSLLNYVGTTLEIMGDVTVTNSRIMNGRTVMRIFGRDGMNEDSEVNASQEKINAVIDGCVLQNAREFILKIGTNRMKQGNIKLPDPSLSDAQGNDYGGYNSPDCDGYVDDDYFVAQYVLTDVVLKDTVLQTSGLFCIGIESNFSGPMLTGDPKTLFVIEGWKNLAGTSYASALHLVGDVKMVDWKDIGSVDSSTLIEADTSQESLAFLALNMSEMLKAVQMFGGNKYSDLTVNKNGRQMVHGGIAFYGGGKNYSVLDLSEYTGKSLKQFNVNLSILQNSKDKLLANQGYLLPLAAGMHDFRFVLETEYGN